MRFREFGKYRTAIIQSVFTVTIVATAMAVLTGESVSGGALTAFMIALPAVLAANAILLLVKLEKMPFKININSELQTADASVLVVNMIAVMSLQLTGFATAGEMTPLYIVLVAYGASLGNLVTALMATLYIATTHVMVSGIMRESTGFLFYSFAILVSGLLASVLVWGDEASATGKKRMESFYRISLRLGAAVEMREVLKGLLEETDRIFETDISSVRLIDPSTNKLKIGASAAPDSELEKFADIEIGEGFIGMVAFSGEPIIVNDISRNPEYKYFPKATKIISSAMAAPLFSGERIVGVLTCASSVPRRFTNDDLDILQTIANISATAVERAAFFEELNNKAKSIIEIIGDGILVIDRNGYVRMCSDKVWGLLELKQDPVGNHVKNLKELISCMEYDVARDFTEGSLDALKGREEMHEVVRVRMIDGSIKYLDLYLLPVVSDLDIHIGSVVRIVDSTSREKTRQIRRELTKLMAQRGAEVHPKTGNADAGDIVELACELLGKSIELFGAEGGMLRVRGNRDSIEEVLLGGVYSDKIEAEARAMTARAMGEGDRLSALLGDGYLYDGEGGLSIMTAPLIVKNEITGAVTLWNSHRSLQYTDIERELLSLFATQAATIIENTMLSARLSKEMMKMESMLYAVTDGVIAVGDNMRVLLINDAARAVLDLDPGKDLRDRHLKEVVVYPDMASILLRSIHTKEDLTDEVTIKALNNRIIMVETSVMEMEDSEGIVGVLRDVTELRRLEQAKSDFVSTVSHELRTPLTSIKAYTETLLRDDVSFNSETQSGFLRIISNETDRLTRLITSLLDVSRIESGRLQMRKDMISLGALIEHVMEKIKNISESHSIEVEFKSETEDIFADSDRIEQVLVNLIGNAVKYSPEGGCVKISLDETEEEIRVSVADEGIGIPPEHKDRVFDRFHRVDNSASRSIGGTGLGLYVSRLIVEAHGGRMWFDSKEGEGSCFFFTLPRIDASRYESGINSDEGVS